MTFFHFANCVALAYIPYVIVYKGSGLAEYSAFWKCVQASVAYFVTQLCKMLFLATFFPTSDQSAQFDFIGEFLKATVDLCDLGGMYVVMGQVSGKGQLKLMATAVGWAFAELIATGFLPMWVGARGIEFDWKYIQLSLLANVHLIQNIVNASLVWLYTRSDLSKTSLLTIILLLLLSAYKNFLLLLISQVLGGGIGLLILKVVSTASIGSVALQLYISVSK